MKKITLLAFDNAVSATITGPMDVFHFTGGICNTIHGEEPVSYFQVEAVSPDGKDITCANGLKIGVQKSMHEVEETDLIIISAMMDIGNNLAQYPDVIPWLIEQYEKGTQIAALCMGSFILAQTGLLDGKPATTHWAVAELFRKSFPAVDLKPERLFTDASDLYCSGAYSSCIDLSLYLVEKFIGREVGIRTAKVLVHDISRISQSPYTTFNFQRNHNDDTILSTQRMMEKNYLDHIDIGQLAEKLGLGRRTFERRFKTATGDTPLYYLQRVRVDKAKKILETEIKTLDEVSYAVGYEDPSFFKKVFTKHAGLPPAAYRDKFQRVMDFQH